VAFAALRSALLALSDDQRAAVLLVGAQGYSYEQAAHICEARVGTMKSRVNRARKRLAELLGYSNGENVGADCLTRAVVQPSG
jgi:RNA polymerase sigma-70 factor (ECF subfamily)